VQKESSKKPSDHLLYGRISVLLYCVFAAVSVVYVGALERAINPFYTILFIFFVALIYFNLFNLRNLSSAWTLFRNNLKLIFLINVTTAVLWIGTFYPLKFLTPAIVAAIYVGLRPITIFLLTLKETQSKRDRKRHLIFSLVIFILLGLFSSHLYQEIG